MGREPRDVWFITFAWRRLVSLGNDQGPEGSCEYLGGPGTEMRFKPGQGMHFNCSRRDKTTRAHLETLIVSLDADPVLWRSVCSAILDRDLFPG